VKEGPDASATGAENNKISGTRLFLIHTPQTLPVQLVVPSRSLHNKNFYVLITRITIGCGYAIVNYSQQLQLDDGGEEVTRFHCIVVVAADGDGAFEEGTGCRLVVLGEGAIR
jgi:hypothetical protein